MRRDFSTGQFDLSADTLKALKNGLKQIENPYKTPVLILKERNAMSGDLIIMKLSDFQNLNKIKGLY